MTTLPNQPFFLMKAPDQTLAAQGLQQKLAAGALDTLAARTADFFAAAGEPAILVGAIPFDRTRQDCLFQPRTVKDEIALLAATGNPDPGAVRELSSHPDRQGYAAMVVRALAMIAQGGGDGLRKVVLSRILLGMTGQRIDPLLLAQRLARDPSVTTFLFPLPAEGGQPGPVMVGASPELLLSKKGRLIASHPLAGSAPRHADDAEDKRAAAALMRSDKDQREHALVVEYLHDMLTPFCSRLAMPKRPTLRSTATMWHLGTPIEGILKDDGVTAAQLLAALHPTPAVSGYPAPAAREAIRALEPHDRGFYAGAFGWLDARGDGTWYMTLRCAAIEGRNVSLFAGAGIVAGSDPMAETAETAAKLQTMLGAMGLSEQGEILSGVGT